MKNSSSKFSKRLYKSERVVFNTLEIFGITEKVKKSPNQIKELEKVAPRIKEMLFQVPEVESNQMALPLVF
jgi:hypothetical protein